MMECASNFTGTLNEHQTLNRVMIARQSREIMNSLSYFCIYSIGFLSTYKFAQGHLMDEYPEQVESARYEMMAASVIISTFWPFFWVKATFEFVGILMNGKGV